MPANVAGIGCPSVIRWAPLPTAAGLTAAEGVALVGVSALYLDDILSGRPHDLTTALFSAALGFAAALVLLLLARPLAGGRRFARGPVVLLELLAVPVAGDLLQVGQLAAGLAVLVPAALTLALLLAPSARAPFESPRAPTAGPGRPEV
jgi:hypothetical protein